MKNIAKIIGTRIKMLRFAKHMQQTELAKRMGISQTHMSNIESGRNNVTIDNLYKLHEILECPMSSFFIDIDGKPQAKENKDVFSLEDLTQALILLKKQWFDFCSTILSPWWELKMVFFVILLTEDMLFST